MAILSCAISGKLPKKVSPFSSELIYEVQNTHYQRENAIELFGLLKYNVPTPDVLHIDISQKFEQCAAFVSNTLDISRHIQIKLQSDYDAFRFWKNILEKNGVSSISIPEREYCRDAGFFNWANSSSMYCGEWA